jgi:hypothetical protein
MKEYFTTYHELVQDFYIDGLEAASRNSSEFKCRRPHLGRQELSIVANHAIKMSPVTTAIVSHGDIDREPRETYGKGKILLRIG